MKKKDIERADITSAQTAAAKLIVRNFKRYMELKKKRDAEAKEAQEANGEFELEIKKIENENE